MTENRASMNEVCFQALLKDYRCEQDKLRVQAKGHRQEMYERLQQRLLQQALAGGQQNDSDEETTYEVGDVHGKNRVKLKSRSVIKRPE